MQCITGGISIGHALLIVGESSVESSSTCSSSKFKNDRYLNTPEKILKIESLRKRAYSAEQNCREITRKN